MIDASYYAEDRICKRRLLPDLVKADCKRGQHSLRVRGHKLVRPPGIVNRLREQALSILLGSRKSPRVFCFNVCRKQNCFESLLRTSSTLLSNRVTLIPYEFSSCSTLANSFMIQARVIATNSSFSGCLSKNFVALVVVPSCEIPFSVGEFSVAAQSRSLSRCTLNWR